MGCKNALRDVERNFKKIIRRPLWVHSARALSTAAPQKSRISGHAVVLLKVPPKVQGPIFIKFLTFFQSFCIVFMIRHRAPARSVCGFRLLSSQLDSSKILDSELEYLLEDSKDPPKTAGAVSIPARFQSAPPPRRPT